MATTFKLPKVTEYVKNVGKSVAFMTIDKVTENTPGIKDFVDINDDIFKEVYSSVKNYRQTVKSVGKSIKQSNEYQAVEAGIKYLIEDAKTGKLYNQSRVSDLGESALGLNDFDDDMEFTVHDYDGSSSSTSDIITDAIGTAVTSQSTIVAQSTDLMIRSNKASTKLIMAHMDRTSAALSSSIGSVYSAISTTNAFLNGPMMAHLENSKRFYEENLKATNEINGMLKEILEMQRNLYKAEGDKQRDSKLSQSMMSDGGIDIGGYLKNVKSNMGDILDSTGLSMFKMDFGSGSNPYMLYAATPFQLILGPIIERMMSKDFKKALSSFDKGVTSMFSQFVSRMNTARKNNEEFGIMGILGKLFGIDLDIKDSIDARNYKKDAVPFDGITRQSIIETIPGYLARIESALTGSGERHYDFQSGTWKSAKQIEKEFDDHRKRAIVSSNYSIISDFDQTLSKIESSGEKGKKYAKSLRKQQESALSKIFDMGGDFRPQGMKDEFGDFIEGWKLYGFKSKKDFNIWLKSLSRDTIKGIARDNLTGIESLSKTIRNEEINGGTGRHLFNGAYDIYGTGDGKRNNPSKFMGGGNGLLAFSADKSGRNVFWYLNAILDGINNYRRNRDDKNTSSNSSSRYKKVKARKRHTSSNKSESNESSDPDPDPDGYEFDELIEEENKRRTEERNKDGSKRFGDWINKKFGNSKIGQSLSKAFNGAENVLSKPMEYMTKMLNKADESIFKLMFGEKKITDDDGNEVNNVFQWIIHEVKSSFKKLNEEIKKIFNPILDKIKDTLKPLWEKHGKPIVNEMKNIVKSGFGRTRTGLNNTFGKGFNVVKNKLHKGDVVTADEVENAAKEESEWGKGLHGFNEPVTSAYGRYVTKRGITMISPGEIIIPASFDKKEQKKMLALEKRDRSRISNAIGLNAEGTVDTDKLKDHLKNIYNENKGSGSRNIASGIMGAGAGALLMGNPLLGAMAGAGLSILNNSETFKSAIFGKELKDGTREGGLIPKKVSDFFKKALPDMGDFGIAGGLLGLFTPFGPLGGAAIGAGVGMLKNSESFKKFIFGDEETGKDGLISKESAEKAKAFLIKAAPKAAVGAIAGAFLGPFGLVGNAALGASAGLISSTDTFHKVLFGDPEDSNSTGGLFGAINRGIIDPAKKKIGEILEGFKGYTRKYILDPLKNFWEPFQQSIKNTITSVGDRIRDHLNDMFEKKLGLPIYDFLQEKLFKPVTKVVFGILKAPVAIGKAIVAAPFKALGGIGNSMRMSRIRKGTAYEMSAAERLAWRKQHKGRAAFRGLFGKDRMIQQDEMLAGMTEEQLNEIAINSRAGLESIESLQKSKGKAKEVVSQEFSKFFNEKVDGSIRYDRIKGGYKEVNKILKKIEEKGDVEFARNEINKIKGLTDEEKSKLFNSVSDKIAEVGRTSKAYDSAKDLTKNTDAELSKLLGRKVKNRKDKRQIYRSAEAELKARNKAKGISDEESTPEADAVETFKKEYETRTDTIIKILKDTSTSLKKMINPNYDDRFDANYRNFAQKASDAGAGAVDDIYRSVVKNGITKTAMDLVKDKKSDKDFMHSISQAAITENSSIKAILANNNAEKPHEDSKEAVDAKKAAEEDEKDEKTANAAERESASWLEKLHNKFFGDKKDEKKKEGGGLLGRIGSAIGSVFTMLGGPVSTIAKIGLSTVGIAGGVSILGYASEWIKESFWPKLKEILFGSDNDPTSGIIDKIGEKFRTVLFGDESNPDDGLWGKFKNTKIGLFFGKVGEAFGTTVDKIKEKGGIKEYFVQEMMPKIIDKFLIGWGYSMENIVAPLTSLIVKHAPAMLASLGSALIKGITSAIFKKEITRDKNDGVIIDTTEFGSMHSSINTTLGSMVSDTVKNQYSTVSSNISSGRILAPIEWSNYFDSNYKSADETYDSDGNHLNKTSDEIIYTKEKGISGLLGAKRSTNKLYYDENGNIALDSYDQMNTVDSVGSRVAKSTGSGLLRGIGGSKGIIGSLLSRASGKGFGSGFMGLGTGAIGKGFKLTGKTLNAGNKFGNTINNMMGNSLAIGDFTKSATQEYIDTLVSAGAGSVDDITKLVTEKGISGAAKELTKTLKNSPNWGNMRHAVMGGARDANLAIKDTKNLYGIGAKNSDNIASTAANTADDSAGFISKTFNKIKTKISKKGAEKAGVAAANAADNVVDDAATVATKGATKAAEAIGKVTDKAGSGLAAKIASIFSSFADSKIGSFLFKACSAGTTKAALQSALKKVGEKLGKNIIGKAASKALSAVANVVGKFSPLTIAIWVKDFIAGYDQADTLLGVAKGDEYKVGVGQKCLCGLLNLINNQLTFGLIPTETIIDIIIEFLFPLFGLSADELNAARANADNVMDEWNKAHPEETYTNLEDFNNKDKWWYKAKTAIGKKMGEVWGNVKESASETWGKVKEGAGKAWNKTKEIGGKATEFIKTGFTAIGDKAKDVVEKATDVGKFIKDLVTNTFKVAINPEYKWNIDDYLSEDDPLAGVKKTIHSVMKVPLTIVGLIGRVGKKVFDKVKGFVVDIKDGFKDAWGDISAVSKGEYTVFNKEYWKFNDNNEDGENPLGIVSKITSTMLKVMTIPHAMLGWTGSKVWSGIKKLISGAKEGTLDAKSDVQAVKSGKYTIFSKDYWKTDKSVDDNEISLIGNIFGVISRIFQAPSAMLGWTGTKIKEIFINIVNNAKEGALDASKDVQAVKSGKYTIFSKDYWTSTDDSDNPLSKLGSVFGFITRIAQAPMAMLGWTGTKIKEIFINIVNNAKEGALDVSKNVDAVKSGKYTIFSKDYWTSEKDDSNPLSKLGSVFGFVTRLTQAPMAMLGYTFTKVKDTFTLMINGIKDIQSDTDNAVKKVENGTITIFDKSYWSINVDENNPLGVLGKVMGFIERMVRAPILLIKGLFKKIGDKFLDWLDLDSLSDFTGGEIGSGSGRGRRGIKEALYGKGHIYQSDSIIANMKYGDSTIGKSGCAPVAATNLINNINPNTMSVQEAAAFAEKNGLTVRGGGTDMSYFNKFLSSKGIATSNTTNKDSVISALENGHQVIILGKDSNNAPGVPFGSNPHFVTATGIDNNGNVIVQDPDLPQSSVVYKKNNLFKSMISSIITNGNNIKMKGRFKHGLGKRLWGGSASGDYADNYNYDSSYDTSSASNYSNTTSSDGLSVNNLLSELGNLGTNTIKYAFGDAYSALYGNDESSNSTDSSSSNNSSSVNLYGNSNGEKIWNFLRDKGYTPAGTAGIMGNLYAESGLISNNIQNTYESRLGSDSVYTKAVDNKSHSKNAFANDSAGYGLAQWTYNTRKKGLYEATVEQGKSIADLSGQLSYLDKELKTYKNLYKTLTSTSSVNTASDKVLSEFERPAVLNYNTRRNYSNTMFSKYRGSGRVNTGSATNALNSYGEYNEYYGTDRPNTPAPVNSPSVDYVTFLQTIVTLLTNISGNTAMLSKILEILSKHLDINIDKAEIEAAANAATAAQTKSALNNLIKNNGGDSSKVSKLLNNQDTEFIFKAMSAIAQE